MNDMIQAYERLQMKLNMRNMYQQVLTEYLSEKLSPIVSQGTENIDVVTSREQLPIPKAKQD